MRVTGPRDLQLEQRKGGRTTFTGTYSVSADGKTLSYKGTDSSVAGKPPVTFKAGDALFIPAGTSHSAKNVGSGKGAELATYVVEKGKPLFTLVT